MHERAARKALQSHVTQGRWGWLAGSTTQRAARGRTGALPDSCGRAMPVPARARDRESVANVHVQPARHTLMQGPCTPAAHLISTGSNLGLQVLHHAHAMRRNVGHVLPAARARRAERHEVNPKNLVGKQRQAQVFDGDLLVDAGPAQHHRNGLLVLVIGVVFQARVLRTVEGNGAGAPLLVGVELCTQRHLHGQAAALLVAAQEARLLTDLRWRQLQARRLRGRAARREHQLMCKGNWGWACWQAGAGYAGHGAAHAHSASVAGWCSSTAAGAKSTLAHRGHAERGGPLEVGCVGLVLPDVVHGRVCGSCGAQQRRRCGARCGSGGLGAVGG